MNATTQLQTDMQVFERAVQHAHEVIYWRATKARPHPVITPRKCEANARAYERRVREIALQSEIILARRADAGGDGIPCAAL